MSKNTIKLKKYVDINVEYKASAALSPGHLIELHTDGKVRKHAASAGPVLPMFALEDELRGRTIDEAFATDDPVQCWVVVRGEEVYAVLAHGEIITIGNFLMSAGDGTLKKYSNEESSLGTSVDKHVIVGVALEAKDLGSSAASGYGTGDTPGEGSRIKVRII